MLHLAPLYVSSPPLPSPPQLLPAPCTSSKPQYMLSVGAAAAKFTDKHSSDMCGRFADYPDTRWIRKWSVTPACVMRLEICNQQRIFGQKKAIIFHDDVKKYSAYTRQMSATRDVFIGPYWTMRRFMSHMWIDLSALYLVFHPNDSQRTSFIWSTPNKMFLAFATTVAICFARDSMYFILILVPLFSSFPVVHITDLNGSWKDQFLFVVMKCI